MPLFELNQNTRDRINELKQGLVLALVDVGSLIATASIHKLLDVAAEVILDDDFKIFVKVLKGAFVVAFGLIYLHFCVDMVLIFIPWLRPKRQTYGVDEGEALKPATGLSPKKKGK